MKPFNMTHLKVNDYVKYVQNSKASLENANCIADIYP